MKTAIYIEDGVVQLVITPESEFERSAMKSFDSGNHISEFYHGAFYDCQGGWTRHTRSSSAERSLIIRATTEPQPEE